MSRVRCLARGLLAIAFAAVVAAQELPPIEAWSLGAANAACLVQPPAGYELSRFVPVVVLFPSAPDAATAAATASALGKALANRGFVVVVPVLGSPAKPGSPRAEGDRSQVFKSLRQRIRIEQGGLHAVVAGDEEQVLPFLLEHRAEFQTITVFSEAADADLAALRLLPSRRVHSIAGADPEALAAHLQKLHAERTLPGPAGEVAKVLDDFHDSAAVGDAKRYFAILPDDAVFLGTDGTERWTGEEFRKFAMPYFERGSAWTYVCLRRVVNVEPGDTIAWFDETFDNEAYGECRGSGVMAKRGDHWVMRQYHLTVPVPNDVTRAVAARIRAFQDKVALPETTIVFVRHAEKTGPEDDELSEAGKRRAETLALVLRELRIDAIYSSGRRRATETVAPSADARGMRCRGEADPKRMVQLLRRDLVGRTILVCGHSNTVPEMLKMLGVTTPVTIGDDDYDRLFVVTLTVDGPRLLQLRY